MLLPLLATALAPITFAGVAIASYVVASDGIVTAINNPAWQTFIVDPVDLKDLPALPTVIALNAIHSAVGSSTAGILLALIRSMRTAPWRSSERSLPLTAPIRHPHAGR